MHSTKIALISMQHSHSKAAGPRNQRLCLVPHTCRFLGQQSLGIDPAVKGSSLTLSPLFVPRRGTASPTSQSYGRLRRLFCGLVPRIALSLVEKGRPQHPLQCVEAKVARFCFLPMPLGTGTTKARALAIS